MKSLFNDQIKQLKGFLNIFLKSGVNLKGEITFVGEDYIILTRGDDLYLKLDAIASIGPLNLQN
jgi:sRNA-binding regulator protein Hfq